MSNGMGLPVSFCTPEDGSSAFFRDETELMHCEDEPLFCTGVKLGLSH